MSHNSDEAGAKPWRISEMINYQAKSVVSQTILDKKAGTITLFAFDAGQGLSEHTAPFDALVQILEGEAEILIAGKPYAVKAGDMMLMPSHRPHALRAQTKFKMLLVMIRE